MDCQKPRRSCPRPACREAGAGVALQPALADAAGGSEPLAYDMLFDPSISSAMVRPWLMDLQQRIVDTFDRLEQSAGSTVRSLRDPWQREDTGKLHGDGITCVLEGGRVFERAGCGFSHVRGTLLPASATQKRPELTGASYEALGVSVVIHPLNPYVPTVHMNVRMITAQPPKGPPLSWFGGGMDMTPFYAFEEDVRHFHSVCRASVRPFGEHLYPRYKAWCDEFFFLRHRNEARGIGGIFFDDVTEFGVGGGFALMQSVGEHFLPAYMPIVEKRKTMPWGERERAFQCFRRGRYVEFNLIWDRGTKFGLQSGGRTESILMSMPPHASWAYERSYEPDSPEAELGRKFLIGRDWL